MKILKFAAILVILYELWIIANRIYQLYYMKIPIGAPMGVI